LTNWEHEDPWEQLEDRDADDVDIDLVQPDGGSFSGRGSICATTGSVSG